MDGQQRLLGRHPTPEPSDILAFGEEQGEKKKRKTEKQKSSFNFFCETSQICRILKLESVTDELTVGISCDVRLQNHTDNFKTKFLRKKIFFLIKKKKKVQQRVYVFPLKTNDNNNHTGEKYLRLTSVNGFNGLKLRV